jgi:molybdopterin-binding protein
LCSIIVETQKTADYLKVGNEVYILFKETEVSVGKNVQGLLSLRNQINCTVQNIEKGKVLSKVVLNFKNYNIVSIITTNSVEKLQLKIGDNVKAFIKSNEVSLMEI